MHNSLKIIVFYFCKRLTISIWMLGKEWCKIFSLLQLFSNTIKTLFFISIYYINHKVIYLNYVFNELSQIQTA